MSLSSMAQVYRPGVQVGAALIVVAAAGIAAAHRAWIAADPCARASTQSLAGAPELAELMYRHDRQREALAAQQAMLLAAAQAAGPMRQQAAIQSDGDATHARLMVELAQRQADELGAACRRLR